jgi:hypothetical protein
MIELTGFEVSLAERLAAEFQFSDPSLSSLALEVGRHLFVQTLIEVEDIEKQHTSFDSKKEPSIGIFTESNAGIRPSGSRGGLHEWVIRIILRRGVVPEKAKALLEELAEFIYSEVSGVVGNFVLKGRELRVRPRIFAREGDDHAYAETQFRFLVVALPT